MEVRDPTGGEGKQVAEPQLNYGDHDHSGVDISLLRYMLELSPLERLVLMERQARDAAILHEYGRQAREAQAPRDR